MTYAIQPNETNHLFKVLTLTPENYFDLLQLFESIAKDPSSKNFHPHPFNEDSAHQISHYKGLDKYFGAFEDKNLIGYGMLRGWDAHYEIPSLGIYLKPEARGRGLSVDFMSELHRYAKEMQAPAVRLSVYPDNLAALNLYKRIGYTFSETHQTQLVGYFNL